MKHAFFISSCIILMLFVSISSYAGYSQSEAYQYLQTYVLGSIADTCEAWGSKNILSSETMVICEDDTVYSPATFSSWLFSIDQYYFQNWAHSTKLYFVDVNNLANYTCEEVEWWIGNIEMEFLDRSDLFYHQIGTGLQDGGRIEFPDSDPNLYAVLMAAGNGDILDRDDGDYRISNTWRNNVARWFVMLRYLGYAEENIQILHGDYGENVKDVYVYRPFGHPNWPWYFDHLDADFDGDGTPENPDNEVFEIPTEANIETAIEALYPADEENPTEDEKKRRITIYVMSHGADVGTFVRFKTWGGGNPVIKDTELYDLLEPLNYAAELFVCLESCFGGGMFEIQQEDYATNLHAHLIAGSRRSTTTKRMDWCGYFTYYFTSYMLGYYPYKDSLWYNDDDEPYFLHIEPWRKGVPVDDEIRNGEFFFDTWELDDRNDDELRSIREAVEFSWAKLLFWSEDLEEMDGFDGDERYNFQQGLSQDIEFWQDPYYFWPANYELAIGGYCPENDSSGTVSFAGRGGHANWKSGGTINWNAPKKYIVTHNLKFPSMNNAPTTVISSEGDPIEFVVYPGKKIIFERYLGEGNIDNVSFSPYYDGAANYWGGLKVDNTDFDIQDCEISGANYGISVILDDDGYDVDLEGLEISNCGDGAYLRNEDSSGEILLSESDIYDCDYFGVNLNMAYYTDIVDCHLHNNLIGLFSDLSGPSWHQGNEI